MTEISLENVDKAAYLAALYNASQPQGMGFMHYDPTPMTRDEAEELLKQTTYFDYLKGRVMKLNFDGDMLYVGSYDRDNGDGAAERAISELNATGDINSSETQAEHQRKTLAMATETRGHLGDGTVTEGNTMRLGLSDVADELKPRIDAAVSGMKTRAEHLAWCKERAHAELEVPDEAEGVKNALASMTSDLTKHPETETHAGIGLGMMLSMSGKLSTKAEMAKFIDGFN